MVQNVRGEGGLKQKSTASMRDRLISKSIQLFLRTSFKATSIQHITDTLGITKGAFYWHFKSKDELLLTVIEKYNSEFLEKLYAHMEIFEGDFIRKFREYHKYINEYAREHSELCVLFVTLAAEMAGSRTAAEQKIKKVYKRYREFIESLLTSGKNERVFSDGYDVTLNAHTIIAIHSGILLHWYMNKPGIDGPSLARTYRDILLYGMVKKGKGQIRDCRDVHQTQ
jgi:TetR/AcrR family transcriptional regulator, cholesterol catabolism regulator